MSPAAEAMLVAYYQERESSLSIEDLETRWLPGISRERIITVGIELERAGFIVSVPQGGYRITKAGIQHYLSDLEG